MSERYVVFDVETPNSHNDRMSSIAIAVVEDGEIVEQFHSLVNPEAPFNYYNVALTQITPDMVRDKPTFPELWQQIEPIMNSGLLIAHNAPFDMCVLAKCLRDYGIQWKATVDYACTCRMAKRLLKGLENHRLNTLCWYLDIPLKHHDALSDTVACAKILLWFMGGGAKAEAFIKQYDIKNCCACK